MSINVGDSGDQWRRMITEKGDSEIKFLPQKILTTKKTQKIQRLHYLTSQF